MMKTSVLKVHPRLRVLMICIILHGEAKSLVAGSNSCNITRSTVQIVDDCPVSKNQWMEAAERKNCGQYASQCSEPDRLIYHCVINPYVNQTLEVCAYAQNIVLGQCTSYILSGNVIQENSMADCSKFQDNACPRFYRSNEAYKYPGCYQLTKKSTTVKYNPIPTRNPDNTDNRVPFTTSSSITSENDVGMSGTEEKIYSNTHVATIAILLPVIIVFIAVLFGFVLWRREKYTREQAHNGITETECLPGYTEPNCTEHCPLTGRSMSRIL